MGHARRLIALTATVILCGTVAGCTTANGTATDLVSQLQTFVTDFLRQLLGAFLL